MIQLAGNSTLITGVACGIGFAFAKAFVAEGARVAIADIDIDRTRIAAAVKIDVTDQNSIDAGVVETVKAFGQIEILINNAAIFTAAPISKITRQNYQHGINVNAISPGVVGRGTLGWGRGVGCQIRKESDRPKEKRSHCGRSVWAHGHSG